MGQEGIAHVTGDEIWKREYTPWPTYTEYKHSSALSPWSWMSRKSFFSEVSRYFFQESWQQGRISDALPSLHWVCGCILLWTSAPWPAHGAAQATVPALGTHTALSLAYSSLLLTRSVLLLRTISSREGSHSKQSGPWCHSSILRLQNTRGGLQTYRIEGCNKAMCPSNIWPTAIQAVPLCQASPITWMF